MHSMAACCTSSSYLLGTACIRVRPPKAMFEDASRTKVIESPIQAAKNSRQHGRYEIPEDVMSLAARWRGSQCDKRTRFEKCFI